MKKRIARSGAGKRSGYRAIVASQPPCAWFFVLGYAKNRQATLNRMELLVCRDQGDYLLALTPAGVNDAIVRGELIEVPCDA